MCVARINVRNANIAESGVAMAMAKWARRGPVGLFTAKVPISFSPAGYYVHTDDGAPERRGPRRFLLGTVKMPTK
jgi:hypothetical protein